MGARITGVNGVNDLLPLKIETRKLRGIRYTLPVASAQVKSALLMAGLFAEGKTTVIEPTATRDHTERMFKAFSIPYSRKGKAVTLKGPVPPFKGRTIKVPGDISSAAFFIVAALVVPGSRLTLRNVGINPTRTGLLEVLKKMGAHIGVTPHKTGKGEEPLADIFIHSSNLKGVEVGGDLVPRMIDEFPILALAATQAQGTTVIRNAEDLKVKESDRILMMAVTLKKMGANIQAKDDGWVIQGPTPLKGCRLSSGGDHRIAMSLAVAGLVAEGSTTILDTENIDTSFPGFEEMLKKVCQI
jgi:3-phosphoshikimate 1-carboxyvinyltransferase